MTFTARRPWLQVLHDIRANVEARHDPPNLPQRGFDPWEAHLIDLQGEVHADGQERIATCVAFDHLGLPRPERTSEAARRLARVMCRLGWQSSRWRHVPDHSRRLRGYQRAVRTHLVDETTKENDDAPLSGPPSPSPSDDS